jgi:hypothetical protein
MEESTNKIMNQEQEKTIEAVPKDPMGSLCYYMDKYLVTLGCNGETPEEKVYDFMINGGKLPSTISTQGEKVAYRLYPTASLNIINACVRVLEMHLEEEITLGQKKDEEKEKFLSGISNLADMLFPTACTNPEGDFFIHRVDKNKKTIVLNTHGRRVKQLATRLEKYRTSRIEIAKKSGNNLTLPVLTCQEVIRQEIRAGYQRWKIIDPEFSSSQNPLDAIDSLDSMKDNMGFEATYNPDTDGIEGFTELSEREEEEIAQATWLKMDLPFLRIGESKKGNILSTSPKSWLWNYEEDPLDYVVDYVSAHAKPCLEEALTLLSQASRDRNAEQAGTLALTLDPKNKNNPDSYWKIIKRISQHFPSSRETENDAQLKKLDCARFNLCLAWTNRKFGIDPEEFEREFFSKVMDIMEDPKRRDSVTRNEVLLETLKDISSIKDKNWGKKEMEIWLENLQSSAVGAYENSIGMEQERKKLLSKLNLLFKTPREEMEKARKGDPSPETINKIHTVLTSAANAFYTYLSGKTGQMTRRELRTKIYALKTLAERKGDTENVEKLSSMGRFVTSISSQIKNGEWYNKEKENKDTLFRFLLTMIEMPKTSDLEFPGSKEPQAKDALEINIDFLKSFACEEGFNTGETSIKNVLEQCKENHRGNQGAQLSDALKKISKNRVKRVSDITSRKPTLEGAIRIAEAIHLAKDPITKINDLINEELEITKLKKEDIISSKVLPSTEQIKTAISEIEELSKKGDLSLAQLKNCMEWSEKSKHALLINTDKSKENELVSYIDRLSRIENQRLEKNFSFWKGLHYISQNIQSRREEEKYQTSPSGRGTLQNLIAISKAKMLNKDLKGKNPADGELKQFKITATRARSLAPNIGIPIALWLSEKEKGTKTKITQEGFINRLKECLHGCELCLEISKTDKGIEEKLSQFQEEMKDDKNAMNAYIIDLCINMLENEEELKKGIEWQNKNPKKAIELSKSFPEVDTPNAKWTLVNTEKAINIDTVKSETIEIV